MHLKNILLIFNSKNRQITIGTAFIGFVIFLGFIFQSYQSYKLEVTQAESLAQNVSLVLEQQTKSAFRTMDILILSINKIIQERGPNYKWTHQTYSQILGENIKQQSELQGLKIVDENGRFLGSENGKFPNTDISDRDYFQYHKTNENSGLVIAKPVQSRTTGDWVIVLSRRLHSFNNRFSGVVLATLPLKFFETSYNKLNLGQKGNISLFTLDDYTLVARYPVIENLIGKNLSTSALYLKILNEKKDVSTLIEKSALDGEVKLHSYRIIKELNLIIITGLAKSDFLSGWIKNTIFLFSSLILVSIGFLVFFIRYLTNLEKIEESRIQLVRSNKLTSLGEMASGIAHEINNPLAIIQTKSEQMIRKIENSSLSNEVLKEDLKKIIFTTDRISKIIKGLRTFSRNSDSDSKTLVKVSQIIEDTLSFCNEKFKNNSISLTYKMASDFSILCRATEISQVLMNLIGNSFDAVEKLENKWVEIDIYESNSFIVFKVTDSGNGISKQIIDKIMQPFFTTKEVGKGTGLGLSISKGIIEEHGGTIYNEASSEHTCFVFTVPQIG